MKNLITVNLLFQFIFYFASAQTPGDAFFPETANGAAGVPFNHHYLRWYNPSEVVYNEIFLSYDSSLVAYMDSSVLIASGFPGTVIDSLVITNLFRVTRYFWKIVEHGNHGFSQGAQWYFITGSGSYEEFYANDDFYFGTNKWTISGSACGWQLDDAENYLLPSPSVGNVLTANNSDCTGAINTVAEFQQINDLNYFYWGWIEFDSDWKADHQNDSVIIQVSYDQGLTWNTIWSKAGVSDRNQHVIIYDAFTNENYLYDNFRVRFKSVQNGGDSWWAIDNFIIYFASGILTPPYTRALHVNAIEENNKKKVVLNWSQTVGLPGASVYRKSGIPSDTTLYEVIGVITNGALSFVDTTVADSSVYTYKVWGDRFTNESTAYVFSVIPVELISFTADVSGNDVHLNWATASEINNKGFEVERSQKSLDGSLWEKVKGQTEWEKVGFVEGYGTTTESKSYSFRDKNLFSGNYHYRLKQVDFDGTYEYSNIIEVEIGIPSEFSLSQNYPNPFNPVTKIKYSIPSVTQSAVPAGRQEVEGSLVTLKVYDVLGNEVAILVNEEKQPGVYEIEFNATELSSGTYFYKLSAGNFVQTKKMILLK